MTDRSRRIAETAAAVCGCRRRARQRGEADRLEEARLARLVAARILEQADADDALAVIVAGREKAGDDDAALRRALRIAQRALGRAIADEAALRERVREDMRAELRGMMRASVRATAILDRLREMNAAAGYVFVWPELRRLADAEAARFLDQRRAAA